MPTDISSEGYVIRDAGGAAEASSTSGYHDPAGTAFLWIAWTLAFAFWAFSMMIFFGILQTIEQGGPGSIRGGFDATAGGFLFMDIVGAIIVLWAAIAWAIARRTTRDTRQGALTEAATAQLYDSVARSPEALSPDERGGYRPLR